MSLNKIIDTHCHLDSERFEGDLEVLLERSFKQNIDKIIIPAADIKDLPRAVKISEKHANIYFAVGVHPNEAASYDKKVLKDFITHEKCVAVGECGLDYFYFKDTDDKEALKALQKRVFKAQLDLALEFNKPIIIHSREANADTHAILSEFITRTKGEFRANLGYGVLHCFNASELLLGLKEHFYFGIGGVLTFKNAKKLVEILPKIPKDRLLLETDAPFLAPEPHRGERNEPLYTNLVASKMAEILNLSKSEVLEMCALNSERLFFTKEN